MQLPPPHAVEALRWTGAGIGQGEQMAIASDQRQSRPIAICERVLILEPIDFTALRLGQNAETGSALLGILQARGEDWLAVADERNAVPVACCDGPNILQTVGHIGLAVVVSSPGDNRAVGFQRQAMRSTGSHGDDIAKAGRNDCLAEVRYLSRV